MGKKLMVLLLLLLLLLLSFGDSGKEVGCCFGVV